MAGTQNWISVSWGDHLEFGEGEGRLDTPDKLRKRAEVWSKELGVQTILWRENRTRRDGWVYQAGRDPRPVSDVRPDWDEFETVCRAGRQLGSRVYLYVTLFDEGWPLPSDNTRQNSYHNAYHARDVSWQSDFSRSHPEFTAADRSGRIRQWGVLCLAYPEVRDEFRRRYATLLSQGDFDGLFVCLRSQSKPADFADQFGFNPPVVTAYRDRYAVDILREDFDFQAWRNLQGDFLTRFLWELRELTRKSGVRLAVGAPRGDVIGPPLGNGTLAWETWARSGLIDELIIDQNSSRCPSTWLDLWPMHRGDGYLENYLTGQNQPTLREDLTRRYQPALQPTETNLLLARQWSESDPLAETELLDLPCVHGLVFSSFRFDNAGILHSADWRPRGERLRGRPAA